MYSSWNRNLEGYRFQFRSNLDEKLGMIASGELVECGLNPALNGKGGSAKPPQNVVFCYGAIQAAVHVVLTTASFHAADSPLPAQGLETEVGGRLYVYYA